MQLRPYQEKIIDLTKVSLGHGHTSPLLVLPTGGGKTVVFSAIAKRAIEKGNNVLILVHRRELIKQASQKLTDINIEHGIIASGFEGSDHPVQVASVQTLVRRLEKTSFNPVIIIIDEAHHAVAGSWSKTLDKWPDALKIGVTATPCRLDGRGLGEYFDDLVRGPDIGSLVKKGFLCPHKVFAAPNKLKLKDVKIRAGDFARDQLEEKLISADITGDAVEQYRKHSEGLPAIAFCVSVNHAISVRDKFNNSGYKAGLITGKMNNKDRDEVLDALASNKIQVLVSVDVISEGFDLPGVSTAILLRPTKSEGLYLQQVGRILRPKEGKVAIVLDHVGNTFEHGFVDDHRIWSLKAKPRRQRKGEAPPKVKTCPECFAVFEPQPTCPECGYEFPLKTRDLTEEKGDLVELTKSRKKQIKKLERHQVNVLISRARTIEQLLEVAKQLGYKPGWAYNIAKVRRQNRAFANRISLMNPQSDRNIGTKHWDWGASG